MTKTNLLLLFLTGLCNTAHATFAIQAEAESAQSPGYTFNAITHALISETIAPVGPSPGDTMAVNGYGKLDFSSSLELTYDYSIGTRIVDFTQDGKLIYEHGIEMEGVSNQIRLYMDFIDPVGATADEDDADSYTDGFKVFTMEVLPLAEDIGFLDPVNGYGKDQLTFKMIDSDKEKYGIVDNDYLLKISSEISLVDFSKGFPQAFNFGAFDPPCGSLDNPFDSCSRETGNARFLMARAAEDEVVQTPIPAAFGLFLTGFGLLSLITKQNKHV